ncbi:MAG: PocR ligand-binding domain-containing protein [Victivallaceae bacterium]|nr:PocR ligand-binding domain-containing protein [Victivallaceae bacterium]
MKHALEIILRPEIQRLFDQFCSSFDIRILFYSVNGKVMKVGLNRDDSYFCSLIHRVYGIEKCLVMDEAKRHECAEKEEIISYRCHAGINEALAPIYVDKQLVGFAMIGQFRTIETMPYHLKKEWSRKVGTAELEAAFRELPYFKPEKVKDILGLFSVIIDYIVTKDIVALRGNLIVNRIMVHIAENIHRNISISETAGLVGKSVSTVSHLFKSVTGRTFKQSLIEAKLAKADEYFRNMPDRSVKEVAQTLGFEDQFYFSRIYKKYRKISPSEYLKKQR